MFFKLYLKLYFNEGEVLSVWSPQRWSCRIRSSGFPRRTACLGMALLWETQGSRKSILRGVCGVLERVAAGANADWYEPGFKTCHWTPAVEILGWGYDSWTFRANGSRRSSIDPAPADQQLP